MGFKSFTTARRSLQHAHAAAAANTHAAALSLPRHHWWRRRESNHLTHQSRRRLAHLRAVRSPRVPHCFRESPPPLQRCSNAVPTLFQRNITSIVTRPRYPRLASAAPEGDPGDGRRGDPRQAERPAGERSRNILAPGAVTMAASRAASTAPPVPAGSTDRAADLGKRFCSRSMPASAASTSA
jgi:hypothetical protein